MPTRVHKTARALDRERCALLDEMEALDEARLVAKPLPGKWSILEVLEHLVVAERDVLQGLPDPKELTPGRRGLKSRLLFPLVMVILRYGIRVKVPSREMLPKGGVSLDDLRRAWDENQRWLGTYLAGLDRERAARAVFRHPVVGPMTPAQAVHMGLLHVRTHVRQIRKLQRLLG